MQRGGYTQNSGASPPLHHPVPQHHVPIPMMHSPPPPQPQSSTGYSASYTPQLAHGGIPQQSIHPAYGNFLSDPTAQMAFQVGGRATEAAGAYVEQNVGPLSSVQFDYRNITKRIVVWQIPAIQCIKALLQCLERIRPPEAISCAISVATQAMVTDGRSEVRCEWASGGLLSAAQR
jgi:hypothetical protein